MKYTSIILLLCSSLYAYTASAQSSLNDIEKTPVPDISYMQAPLSAEYSQCNAQSRGMTDQLLICLDIEYARHEQLIRDAVAQIIDAPDSIEKDQRLDEIAQWWQDTEQHCQWDAATEGQGQRLDAASCRLNRAANLAQKLKHTTQIGQ
ncbi:hypothetical protein [Acinetobacter larvae]|uniref:Lysozyme inhibitor LprI N-terminal domain-containing protein n=1 Tax=Acinetobacter larvae TaxID=1789224 RepID=A0A1B2LYZ8_9GAMM|nr:hypothetical protein [Acinetobacter larvae]AOA58156.1 hypothetical protein BFG52_07165 [Acinetobacter larvae]